MSFTGLSAAERRLLPNERRTQSVQPKKTTNAWAKDCESAQKHRKLNAQTCTHVYMAHTKRWDEESSLTNLDNLNDREEFGVNIVLPLFYYC